MMLMIHYHNLVILLMIYHFIGHLWLKLKQVVSTVTGGGFSVAGVTHVSDGAGISGTSSSSSTSLANNTNNGRINMYI